VNDSGNANGSLMESGVRPGAGRLPAAASHRRFELATRALPSRRPLIVGVVNITPDSFSDGGRFLEPGLALDQALHLVQAGADILDLGAESTRPGGGVYGAGAEEVGAEVEIERLLPVLRSLRSRTEVPLSVDTRKAEVARIALDEGADLINDVSGLADPRMAPLVAERDAGLVVMHSRGTLAEMQRGIHFDDVALEVRDELLERVALAREHGVRAERIVVDPGIGFGKTVEQNLILLRRIEVLRGTGHAVLVGASRKSFIGAVTGAGPDQRLSGSLAAAARAVEAGADLLRVHDVAETVQFFRLWSAIGGAEAAD